MKRRLGREVNERQISEVRVLSSGNQASPNEFAFHEYLTADVSAGADTVVVSNVPDWFGSYSGYVVFDVPTVEAEIRRVTAIAGKSLVIDGVTDFSHVAGDGVIFLPDFRGASALWFGAKGDGSTDDTAAVQAVIDALAGTDIKTIFFPGATYRFDSGLTISDHGYRFIGMHHRRPAGGGSETGATRFNFYGTGELFEIGTDPAPDPYDQGDYDGFHDTHFEWLSMYYNGDSVSALGNGKGNYGTGTYAVRDWKGGAIQMNRVWIEHFEFGFWGIQSDYNGFEDVWIRYCDVGIYLGPRSDQFVGKNCTITLNDSGVILDRCEGSAWYSSRFQFSGTSTEWTIDIGSTYTSRGSVGHAFYSCWFEHNNSAGVSVDSFVRIGYLGGSDDNQQTLGVTFYNPQVLNNPPGGGNIRATYFMTVANATEVAIYNPSGRWFNFSELAECVGATSPDIYVFGHHDLIGPLNLVNSGTGSPHLVKDKYLSGARYIQTSSGRLYIEPEPADPDRQFYIMANADYRFDVYFPNHASGNPLWLSFSKRVDFNTAAPTSGTWQHGDLVINETPGAGVPFGWVCVSGGTPGTWRELADVDMDWTEYSDTSTIVGWSSFTTKEIWYKKVGSIVYVKFHIIGTSNSTTTSFTLPHQHDGEMQIMVPHRVMDNGTWSIGFGFVNNNQNVYEFKVDAGASAWTASGTKRVIGEFFYHTDD